MKNEQLTQKADKEAVTNTSVFMSKAFNEILDGAVPKSKQMVQLVRENTSSEEKPLVMLKLKYWVWALAIVGVLWSFWFFSFGTIIPYLTTGDFAAIWPAYNGKSIITKAGFFIGSWLFWLYSPALIQGFRTGDVAFYENHVEVEPYLGIFKKRMIRYDVMHVKQRGDRGMVLTNGIAPKWREHPFYYWKAIYWNGIGVTMMSMGVNNPENLDHALLIIRERAITISKF